MTSYSHTLCSGRHRLRRVGFVCILAVFNLNPAAAQARPGALDLLRLAKTVGPDLARSIGLAFTETQLEEGTAAAGHLSSFFFAVEAAVKPALVIDGAAGPQLQSVPNTSLWYAVAEVSKQGAIHSYFYVAQGKRFGGSNDLAVFGPLAYLEASVSSELCRRL